MSDGVFDVLLVDLLDVLEVRLHDVEVACEVLSDFDLFVEHDFFIAEHRVVVESEDALEEELIPQVEQELVDFEDELGLVGGGLGELLQTLFVLLLVLLFVRLILFLLTLHREEVGVVVDFLVVRVLAPAHLPLFDCVVEDHDVFLELDPLAELLDVRHELLLVVVVRHAVRHEHRALHLLPDQLLRGLDELSVEVDRRDVLDEEELEHQDQLLADADLQ